MSDEFRDEIIFIVEFEIFTLSNFRIFTFLNSHILTFEFHQSSPAARY